MLTVEIVRIRRLGDLERPESLLGLVDQIMAAPPYSYAPGEITPTDVWFPALLERAGQAVLAVRADEVVGYCVALPFETYGKLNDYAGRLGVDPATTMYVAELGVAAYARRRGIAGRLLEDVHAGLPPRTTGCLVRTLASNAPAIALYQRHGYTLVPGIVQPWNGRDRVFLSFARRDQTPR